MWKPANHSDWFPPTHLISSRVCRCRRAAPTSQWPRLFCATSVETAGRSVTSRCSSCVQQSAAVSTFLFVLCFSFSSAEFFTFKLPFSWRAFWFASFPLKGKKIGVLICCSYWITKCCCNFFFLYFHICRHVLLMIRVCFVLNWKLSFCDCRNYATSLRCCFVFNIYSSATQCHPAAAPFWYLLEITTKCF